MAVQNFSPALPAPAVAAPYPMAQPGYGKRSAPGQLPARPDDFALLPLRERYIAGFIEHLPEGASMSVKCLAKQIPLYGQQAIASALTALSVAGHLRRVRCAIGVGDEVRWVFRTFWSRSARDSEWWANCLTPGVPQSVQAPMPAPAPVPASVPVPAPVPCAVPPQRPAAPPVPEGSSRAYLALAGLGRIDTRLPLSAEDCSVLEGLAEQWFARGVNADYLTSALTAGLPAQVDSPVGFLRRRLVDKLPPAMPTAPTPPPAGTPAPRVMMECTDCGAPGPAAALPDGLCRDCRQHAAPAEPVPVPPAERDVTALVAGLRDLLKAP
ncbi:MarR family transcriptional regulator [Streptomyces sp. NBC_00184]|uniref:MarR family transcriptional regulator n=1 Tax=Streptomyces sp. NBC_00184 TaxID=2975673 RepID=UPI002E2B2C21|nr:MarR family transcriptional regulator [Streptomyces sp. NBC_00184]